MAAPFGMTPEQFNSGAQPGAQSVAPVQNGAQPASTGAQTPVTIGTQAPVQTTPFGISPATFNASVGTQGDQGSQSIPIQKSMAETLATPATDTWDAAKSGLAKAYEGFKQTLQAGDVAGNDLGSGFALMGRGILNEAGGLIEAGSSPITGTLKTLSRLPVISQTVDAVKKYIIDPSSDAISNVPALQEFMQKYPNADEVAANLITIGGALAGGGKSAEIKGATADAADTFSTGFNALKEKVSTATKAPEVPAPDAPGVFTPEMKAQVDKVATDWSRPLSENSAAYNKARVVAEKDPQVGQFLAENKIDPFSHIEDGIYQKDSMEATADKLRDSAGTVTRDALRPALHNADYGQPPMAVTDLKPNINTADTNITAGDAESIKSMVDSELEALKRKYPNGMTLVNQLDEKINYDKNGGYKQFASSADNNKAIANRTIANALRTSLDANVPEGIPIKDVNAYSSKFYRAADYLEALAGRRAPTTVAQRLVQWGSRMLGAKAGAVVGGDLVSEFVGYHVGKLLEQSLENMTNPMRDAFIRNLQIQNPEAYQRLYEYLGKAKMDQATSLKLPAPNITPVKTAVGTPRETTIAPPAGQQSEIRVAPTVPDQPMAENPQTTSYNPKTGDTYVRDLKTGKVRIIPKKK